MGQSVYAEQHMEHLMENVIVEVELQHRMKGWKCLHLRFLRGHGGRMQKQRKVRSHKGPKG